MTPEQAQFQVYAEVTRENREVRHGYINAFSEEIADFCSVMGGVVSDWLKVYEVADRDSLNKKVLSLGYAAISLNVSSMKLFLSGNQVASGNTTRQVSETIALTLLCSVQELGFLSRFDDDRYSSKNAIRDLNKHCLQIGVKRGAVEALEDSQKFYSSFSHPSKLTLGTLQSFSGEGIYVGAAYDPGKSEHYRVEISNRLRLAKVFPSFLHVLNLNLAG